MSDTIKKLDKIAASYHQTEWPDKFIEDRCQFHTYNWVIEQIQGYCNVLEMGYGEGNFTELLVQKKFETTVIEGSKILIEKARKIYAHRISLVHTLFEDFIAENKFDYVLATHVLEHVDQPVQILKKMKSWLKVKGKAIVIVPNRESIHRQLAVIMGLQPELDSLGQRDILVGHQRVYSLSTLEKDVESAGLKVVNRAGFFLKTLPNSMMLNYSDELIDALNKISDRLPINLLANIALVVERES